METIAEEMNVQVEQDPTIITSVLRDEKGEILPVHDDRKPQIDWLEDALTVLEDGTVLPLFNVGDRIVIERHIVNMGITPKWLDTQTYTVKKIDDDTGDIELWNVDLMQWGMSNYKTGHAMGFKFKLPPKKGNIGKKKRGRPKKIVPDAPVTTNTNGEVPKKKGRGRPKGAKNRPKDVIKQEKAKLAEEKKAKGGKRTKKAQ